MYVWKNLLNLDCKDSICFGICKMKGQLERNFSSQKIHAFVLKTFKFLIVFFDISQYLEV